MAPRASRKVAFDPRTAEVFTAQQVAAVCRVSVWTVYKWKRRHNLPHYDLPCPVTWRPRLRFRRDDVIAFMRAFHFPTDLIERKPTRARAPAPSSRVS